MDTQRSEYSEDGGASTFRSGYGGSVASLSYSQAGSHDSRSTRSSFLNNYEQRFLKRKAEKKKKRERETKSNQVVISTEERFKADREADRQVRKLEMAAWMTPPTVLKRNEQANRKRSRERMKGVLEWYSSMGQEMQPTFTPPTNDGSESGVAIDPIMQDKLENQQQVLAFTLERQLMELKMKLACVERLTEEPRLSPAKQLAGPGKTRRRRAGPGYQLSPLHEDRITANQAAINSHAASSSQLPIPIPSRMSGSASTGALRHLVSSFEHEDAADKAELESFLKLHRRLKKQEPCARKIQSTWRMFQRRRVYLRWKRTRTRHRLEIFQAWHFSHRVHKRSQGTIVRKYFIAWKSEVEIALRLREIELKLFRQAEMQSGLPKLVMNLVFTSTDHDIPAKQDSTNTAAATAKQASIAPARSSFAFFMQTFAGADQVSSFMGAKDSRIQQMRLKHTEARRAVSKKIVQQFFLLWKQVHQANQRIGLNAQLCIKRAARLAFGSRRPVWSAEKLMTIFDMWARWASFHRCKRQGIPVTRYAQSNPQWDIWLHQYQERKIRQLKATAKSPLARMKRYFYRLHAFSSHAIVKKRVMELALQHYNDRLGHLVLVLWREEIAESAALKKLCRNTLNQWRHYVLIKQKLRPRRNAVISNRKRWEYSHTWKAWTGVHLRSCFKRELHLSRMEHWRWRSKVHRILFIWMDIKAEVNKWKTFEAWRNFIQRRKLYLMLRFHCDRIQRRNLLYGILNAWKSVVWRHDEGFLEDRLKLNAWAAYEEIAPTMSMLFFGYYGNAAAIFGGVPAPKMDDSDPFVVSRSQTETDERLPYTANGIRRFQTILLQDSLADVRNTVLHSKHLINAVDEDSGNTPLHIVMQIEDSAHRNAELEFLLSEGAATWDRPNRHGLTPKQLAPDDASKILLDKGVYEFHAANIMRSPGSTSGGCQDFRLAWCITTLMSSEWVRGERLAGNIKVREWHSVMKEALWLRQERMFFASASEFSPAILRCRAFLNGMRHRIYRSPYDWIGQRLEGMQPVRQMTTRRLMTQHSVRRSLSHESLARNEDAPLAWLTSKIQYSQQSPEEYTRHQRAKEFGELEPYARFILSPTLDCEPAEKALVHSFVGVLYSLEFTVPQVMATCEHLEDRCHRLEYTVSSLSDDVQRLEWQALGALYPQDPSNDAFPLRAFSDRSDLECFFRRKLFELDVELFRMQIDQRTMTNIDETESGASSGTNSSDNGDITAPMLIKEASYLIAQKQRKLRKLEKKQKTLEQQLQEHETNWRVPLAKTTKQVSEICEARMALELTRLQTTYALVKQSDILAAIDSLQRTKEVLLTGDLDQLHPVSARSTPKSQLQERKCCLELEFARFSMFFLTKTDNSELPHERLRGLQRKAVAALGLLFITNLFRCCCCWMVENLIAAEKEEEPDFIEVEQGKKPIRVGPRASTPVKNLAREAAVKSARRRSSVTMTRTVLESLHRDSMMVDLAEQQVFFMKQRYADSATLIFNDERSAIHNKEQQEKVATKLATPMFAEMNPITGELEQPPKHLLDLDALPIVADYSAREAAVMIEAAVVLPRNRKKEQLLRAMFEDQQKRKQNDSESDGKTDDESIYQLPAIHSEAFEFCNFTLSASRSSLLDRTSEDTTLIGAPINDEADSMDMIWRRVGRPEEASNKSSNCSESDVFSSPDDELAFHASLRLMSAHKDRKPLALMNSVYNRASVNEALLSVQMMDPTRTVTAPASQSEVPDGIIPALTVDSVNVSKRCEMEANPVPVDKIEESADLVLHNTEFENPMDTIDPRSSGQVHDDVNSLGINTDTEIVLGYSESNNHDDEAALDDTLNSYLERIRIDSFLFQQPRGSTGNSEGENKHHKRTPALHDPGIASGEERRLSHIHWEAGPSAPPLKPLPLVVESQPLSSLLAESTDSLAMEYQLQKADHRVIVIQQYAPRPQHKKGSLAEKDPQFSLLGASLSAKSQKKTVAALLNVQLEPMVRRVDSESAGSRPNTRGDSSEARTSRPSISVTIEQKKTETKYSVQDSDIALFQEPSGMALEVIGSGSNASVDKTKALAHTEPVLPAISPSRRAFDGKSAKRTKPRQTQSCVDLHVAGATVQPPESSTRVQKDEEIAVVGDLKGSLSKRQKESVWREFTGTPLSESVQNAYAMLYPQTYQSTLKESGMSSDEAVGYDIRHHGVLSRARSKGDLSAQIQGQCVTRSALQQNETARDKQFWSAIEGYKSVGASILIAMDSQTKITRRKEKAIAIFNKFLSDHSAQKLSWVDMYPNEVAAVRRNIHSGSKNLFNALQQTTQLHIFTALAQRDELGS